MCVDGGKLTLQLRGSKWEQEVLSTHSAIFRT